ncbi:hypothetical protein LMH73_024300 [Vibrio splendidus]|nr:hypothetical protein [Vibrio splendidus]MCC4880867.1 hypothetical protein [Vibrio splendidus]
MKKKLLLIGLLSAASFCASATTSDKLCTIDFPKTSDIGFFSRDNVSIDNKAEGAFVVTTYGEAATVYAYPSEGVTDRKLIHGRDYIWMIDNQAVSSFGGYLNVGTLGDVGSREFVVYPKVIPELMHAGDFRVSLDLKVECRPVMR